MHCLDASTISLFGEWLVEIFNASCLTDVMCSTRKMKGLSCTDKFAMVSLRLQRCLWWDSVLIIVMFGSKVLNSLTLIGSSTEYTYKVKKKEKRKDLHQVKANWSWYFLTNPSPIILAYDRIDKLFWGEGRSMLYSIYCHRWASTWGLNLKRILIKKKRCLIND